MDTAHLLNTQQNILHIIGPQINSTSHNHKYKYKESYYYDVKLEFGLVLSFVYVYTHAYVTEYLNPSLKILCSKFFSQKCFSKTIFLKEKSRILRNST